MQEPAPRARRISTGSLVFSGALALATALTGWGVLLAASGAGAGDSSELMLGLLLAGLVICLGLGVLVARRIALIARGGTETGSGGRLHLRFMALFSFAAVAPAVLVALFLGLLASRGIEGWFSERLKTTVESTAMFARSFVTAETEDIRDEVLAMATDLNRAAGGLAQDREGYENYLLSQAVFRRFPAAYVIDRSGATLAKAEAASAPGFLAPSAQAFADANAGDVSMRTVEEGDLIRALYRLEAYPDAYLYVARFVEEGILARLRAADAAVVQYREAESRRARLQTGFALSYATTALIVLLAAIWLGLSSASRISIPVGRLADAAGRVAAGDLRARVDVVGRGDELDGLAEAFNLMTARLEAQHADLVAARQDAEARTRFIGAVLSGVSAGVIGLDAAGRITAANPTAAALLGAPGEALIHRRLIDAAPELAALGPDEAAPGAQRRVDLPGREGMVHLLVRRTDDAETGAAVLTFDDVTKLIAAQRHEAWKDVARRIAHEIKNPLTPIQLAAERLERRYGGEITQDRETFLRCTGTILRQVADIGRMVDEFSAFARMPAPVLERVDLAELISATAFAQRLAFADIAFDLEAPHAPLIVECDGRLIGQALTNVLKNAGEAIQARRAQDGEPKAGRVLIRLRDLGAVAAIETIDNGPGLPAKDRARLLEPYVTTRAKGAGLGLAIVKRVLEDHGGALELEDAPAAAGALVRFVLPKSRMALGETGALARQEVAT